MQFVHCSTVHNTLYTVGYSSVFSHGKGRLCPWPVNTKTQERLDVPGYLAIRGKPGGRGCLSHSHGKRTLAKLLMLPQQRPKILIEAKKKSFIPISLAICNSF